MAWVALVGDWFDVESEPEPDSIYWHESFEDFESAKRAMLKHIGEFVSYETQGDRPCLDCVMAAGKELASLAGTTVSSGWWSGNIDGDDYVVTNQLDEATIAAKAKGGTTVVWMPVAQP